jgi:transcriptional regulator with XRE-family HTH domain
VLKKLETTRSWISNYENGEQRIDLVQLREYCAAIGITLKEFVSLFEEALG